MNSIGSQMTPEQYQAVLRQHERLGEIIREYEKECFRGVLKIIHTSRTRYHENQSHVEEIVSLRIDNELGKSMKPYWKTIYSTGSDEKMMEALEKIAASIPQVIEAYKKYINGEGIQYE